jgi:histidinol-phosphate aminotransferase
MRLKGLIKSNIAPLKAYEAKAIPCKVKLDANESPFGTSREILKKFQSAKGRKLYKTLNRYPDPQAELLIKKVSSYWGVQPQNVLQGNGSDELIYYLIMTFGGPVLYPVPTFSMYGIITQALDEKKIEVPLTVDFDLDIDRVLALMKKRKPRLIFLSSPNNPTGNCFSFDKILRIIQAGSKTSLVVIDEAYQAFAKEKSFVSLLHKHNNLVILKTLSKIGLAGLRVGFMIAGKDIKKEVNKVRLPFNLNSLSQMIAVEVLKKKKILQSHIRTIKTERKNLFQEMGRIKGIDVYPSEANFILFQTRNTDNVYRRLLQKGVLIRNMKGVVDGCLRVTVGTRGENRRFLRALKNVLR